MKEEENLLKIDENLEYPQIRFLNDGTHEIWIDEKTKVDKENPLSGNSMQGLFIKELVNNHFL
jgi:hypothetical protein